MKEQYIEIDCSKSITELRISRFFKYLSKYKITSFVCLETEKEFTDVKELFDYLYNVTIPSDKSLSFVGTTDNVIVNLTIGQQTLDWWKATNERWSKLATGVFNSIYNITQINIVNTVKAQTYNVAIANFKDNTIEDLDSFKGSKKDAIEWLNVQIKRRLLKSFLKADIRINLCYDNDYTDTDDLWFTAKELEEMELVNLK